MSAYSSPTSLIHESALTPPDMPTISLVGLKRRKLSNQDDVATGASRIPVKSPTRLNLGTPFNYSAPRSPTPSKISSVKFETRSSIPFPKSSKPAPPVTTKVSGAIQHATSQALDVGTERALLLVGKHSPSMAAKEDEKDGKCHVETTEAVWKTLLKRGKVLIAQTLDRDCECQESFHSPVI